MDIIGYLSQLNYHGKGETFIVKRIYLFLKFCECYEIHYEDVASNFFTPTLEGRVKNWYQNLPTASILSFEQHAMEFHQAFDKYDYQDFCKMIDFLRMKPGKSQEDFLHRLLQLCYEFPKEVIDLDFIKEKFQSLILLTLIFFLNPNP